MLLVYTYLLKKKKKKKKVYCPGSEVFSTEKLLLCSSQFGINEDWSEKLMISSMSCGLVRRITSLSLKLFPLLPRSTEPLSSSYANGGNSGCWTVPSEAMPVEVRCHNRGRTPVRPVRLYDAAPQTGFPTQSEHRVLQTAAFKKVCYSLRYLDGGFLAPLCPFLSP